MHQFSGNIHYYSISSLNSASLRDAFLLLVGWPTLLWLVRNQMLIIISESQLLIDSDTNRNNGVGFTGSVS